MTRFTLLLLLVGVFASICVSEDVRLSVVYPPGDARGVILLWRNTSAATQTLTCNQHPITRVKTASGIHVMPTVLCYEAPVLNTTLKAGGEYFLGIQFDPQYILTPGEAYNVTVAYWLGGVKEPISMTFPYVMPDAATTISSAWMPVKERTGTNARLVLTIPHATGHCEARLEFQTLATMGKTAFYDWGMLDAQVYEGAQGKQMKADGQVMMKMAPPRVLQLPAHATYSRPLSQFGEDKGVAEDRVSIWLGFQQYLLKRGERYRISATTYMPAGEDEAPLEVRLRDIEFTVPGVPEVPPAAANPVTVSFSYQPSTLAQPVQVCFSNASGHALAIVKDEIAGVDSEGCTLQSVTSSRSPGLWVPREATIPAIGTAVFPFDQQHFQLTSGERFRFTGNWTLRDTASEQEYTVTASFPYHLPTEYPTTFMGNWIPVHSRPGLELRLRCALSPAQKLAFRSRAEFPPTTWLEYRNVGETTIPVFDYPTLETDVIRIAGKKIIPMQFSATWIPNIEVLALPPGAILTLAGGFSEPPAQRKHLAINNVIYPLPADTRCMLTGTVALPATDTEKATTAPFAPVLVVVPKEH